jgi:hypothetical protein
MAKAPKRPEIKDEPGADQRFSNILKRALNTPPPRKQKDVKERVAKKPTKRG